MRELVKGEMVREFNYFFSNYSYYFSYGYLRYKKIENSYLLMS